MEDFTLYIKLAFDHVLDWQAYDHILFFMVLTVVYDFKNWKKVLWLVTLFTLGHAATLGLATYELIVVNPDLIECFILLTIIITAFINLITAGKANFHKTNINLIFAFFFGLIHGLGLSGFLRMTLEEHENKLLPLLEFAVGVEIAQIVVVLIILTAGLLAHKWLRVSKRDWILIISALVIGVVIPMLGACKLW